MMASVEMRRDGGTLILALTGKIDSSNAPEIETRIQALRQGQTFETLVLDFEKLEYITSAGLRIVLRLKREIDDTRIINARSEVYEVLEMTGFTDMMDVQKAYRVISVEGCEVIGVGANGRVYRIDPDTIVKVYLNPDSLPEIKRERELARTAFVAGLPTAIPYDVVRVEGGGFGSVFELLNATSFAKLLIRGEKTVDEVARMSVDMLKLIHSKEVSPGAVPDMRAVALGWADFLMDYLPGDQGSKLRALIEAVPVNMHLLHGDFHIKNIMLQNGESLLIDMDTLCHGHPVFELASTYNAYCGFAANDHSVVEGYLGISFDQAALLWRRTLEYYLGTTDEARLNDVQDKARILGQARIMRRTIRRGGLETAEGRAVIERSRALLAEALPRVDSLLF